jgi:UDP-N-acetylmuramyl tripeptide synthase
LLTYGLHDAADVRAEDVELDARAPASPCIRPWGSRTRISACWAALMSATRWPPSPPRARWASPPARAAAALAGMGPVPGRLERCQPDKGLHAFVDYAHTDDALAHVLTSLRELKPRRLIVVFGCGGDRDRTKRPVMGAVANRLADYAIVTSDNPRREDPQAIMDEIGAGMPHREHVEFQVDRESHRPRGGGGPARRPAAGGRQGARNYQEFSHTVAPFDDREVLKRYLTAERGERTCPNSPLDIARWCEGAWTSPRPPLRGVGMDTRALQPGELFLALPGERHDAHLHLGAWAQAAGAVVGRAGPTGHPASGWTAPAGG